MLWFCQINLCFCVCLLFLDAQALMSDMIGSLHRSASHKELKKQLKSTFKGVVETPAPKHIKDKVSSVVILFL